MSFASLRRVLRSARKGLCSTCSKTKHPQLEAAGAGHVGCIMYTFETLGQLVKDEHDVTAVHVAARKGQSSILIYLIENGYVEGVPRARNGATPAHDAAGTGNLDCLQYLLSRTKASAMDKDANQATPLHWAVQSGHLNVVKWLVLNANASINSTANNGITPFHLAAAKNYLDILRWLTAYAYRKHPKPRRVINAKDKNGATPLFHASHAGHLRIIQWLAEKGGGDPTIFNTQGHAPLHAATIGGHLNCVTYLFRFGLATAPGGLRSNDGASVLHFAAADGHISILKWLLGQKECTGNERDYYQCTPLHDAAERGHLKAIQTLCDGGADHLLTDIEGNYPKDLAEKNHHGKCAKYLANLGRIRSKGSSTGMDSSGSKLKRQHNASKTMMDNYRNAPPHQRPLSVFDEDDDDDFESQQSDGQWETLHDLMDESELDSLTPDTITSTNRKRRDLEENMRREAEERQRKKRELMLREKEYEKEIRERLMAEEPLEDKEGIPNKRKKSKKSKKSKAHQSDLRKLSQPAEETTDSITERGIVEKRTWEFESRSPAGSPGRGTFLSKLWPAKKSSSSSIVPDELHVIDESEDNLPQPPPLPKPEIFMGKRPPNLRGRKQAEGDDEFLSDADSDHSSVSSSHSERKQQRKKAKKKRRGSKEDDAFDWQYNKLTVPQSSPPRERRSMTRRPTPKPAEAHFGRQLGISNAFDEVTRELEIVDNSPFESVLKSLTSSSTNNSSHPAFQHSHQEEVSPTYLTDDNMGELSDTPPKRAAPVSLMGSSRKTALKLETSGSPSRPDSALQSKGLRMPHAVSSAEATATSTTDSDSESSEYTSSSDDSTSSSESSGDSSDEESELVGAQMPKRPIMARNIGIGSPRRGLGGVSRARMMARYPRLLKKKPIHLVTVEEVPEEVVHEAETSEEKASLFQALVMKRRVMKEWRKYMQVMKTIYRKAEKMAQRKRRDILAKTFYAWIHVRNLGTVMKNDIDRAITYHDKRLMKRVFNAWYFTKFGAKMPIARSTSMQLMNAELEYIDWLNSYLPADKTVNDISDSLADGTLILKALSAAIGRPAPKHNTSPKVHLHHQDNWKVAYKFMASAAINVKGIEPADLGNVNPAAIHNMFINIFKWEEKRTQPTAL